MSLLGIINIIIFDYIFYYRLYSPKLNNFMDDKSYIYDYTTKGNWEKAKNYKIPSNNFAFYI